MGDKQDLVAYIKEVLRIFGQGCTNAGPTSPFGGNPADCDECLTAAAMSIFARHTALMAAMDTRRDNHSSA